MELTNPRMIEIGIDEIFVAVPRAAGELVEECEIMRVNECELHDGQKAEGDQ